MEESVFMQCKGCGQEFRAARSWQEFHSTECQQAWHRHQRKLQAVADAEARLAQRQVNASPKLTGIMEVLRAKREPVQRPQPAGIRRI